MQFLSSSDSLAEVRKLKDIFEYEFDPHHNSTAAKFSFCYQYSAYQYFFVQRQPFKAGASIGKCHY
jgi:hypothetical protein